MLKKILLNIHYRKLRISIFVYKVKFVRFEKTTSHFSTQHIKMTESIEKYIYLTKCI